MPDWNGTQRCLGRCQREMTAAAFVRERTGEAAEKPYCNDCVRHWGYARYGGGVAQAIKIALKGAGIPLTAWAPKWMHMDFRDEYYLGFWHATAMHARTIGKRTLARNIWRQLWDRLSGGIDPTREESADGGSGDSAGPG